MTKKILTAVILIVLFATISYGAALKSETLPGFSNVSTVQTSTPIDLNVQPDEITWAVATFGLFTSFELTLDTSIEHPCDTATYYPVSTMTGATDPLYRGVNLTGERCVRVNLRTKAGTGGITDVKINIRGLE